MKKKAILIITLCVSLGMANCGAEEKKENLQTVELHPSSDSAETEGNEVQPDIEADNKPQGETDTGDHPDPEAKDAATRKDGERFQKTIMLEGMEETVNYEHVRNEDVGVEMDYEYETFIRNSGTDSEFFISCYEDPENPVNSLEVRRETDDPETALEKIKASLTNDFDTLVEEEEMLSGAGSCVTVRAFGVKNNTIDADSMREMTIIPAPGGCIVAEAHYTIESAEGFGGRMSGIVDTIVVLK